MWRGVSSSAAHRRFSSPPISVPRARPAAMASAASARQLAGEGFGRGDADFGTGESRQHDIGFARDRAFRHIDDGERRLALRLRIAQAPPACRPFRPTGR